MHDQNVQQNRERDVPLARMKPRHEEQGDKGVQPQIRRNAGLIVVEHPEPHIEIDRIDE